MAMPRASAASVSSSVSPMPAASSGRLLQMTDVSNAISGCRLEQPLPTVGQGAQRVAKDEIDRAHGGERLDRLERVVADAQRNGHQLADREQSEHRARLEI